MAAGDHGDIITINVENDDQDESLRAGPVDQSTGLTSFMILK